MTEPSEKQKDDKARYRHREEMGCLVSFLIGLVCYFSAAIMSNSISNGNGLAGALAVAALSGMVFGVIHLLLHGGKD
jgi:hypothetical protein